MTKLITGFLGLGILTALSLSSCKEQPVGVDFGAGKKSDTSYVAPIETPQTKNYYIEEFSGVRCTNCPDAAAKLDAMSIMPENLNRLKIVTIHAGGLTEPNFERGSKQDLRSSHGAQLMQLIYGQPSKPVASFDRLPVFTGLNKLLGSYSQWDVGFSKVKNLHSTTPVNVHITSTYNATDDMYYINAKVAYTEDVTADQYLSIFLVEDSIVDTQLDPHIDDFTFRHVLRQAITPINGAPILNDKATKQAGLVYEINYTFKMDMSPNNEFRHNTWNINQVHLVALVHNASSAEDKRVYQAEDTYLKSK